jgi:hypothetical protein
MRVLHTMSFLIERMGPQIKSSNQIGSLAQYLPLLWDMDHNMLKAAVVSTSIQLVHVRIIILKLSYFYIFTFQNFKTGFGEWIICFEGIPFSCNSHLDGFKNSWTCLFIGRWIRPVAGFDGICSGTTRVSKSYFYFYNYFIYIYFSDSFLSLVDNLIPLLSISTEHMKMSIALVNSFSIIYPEFFAEKYGSIVCAELNSAMSDMRAEGIAMVLRCVETFLRTSPINGPISIKPIVGKIFQ